MGNLGGGEILVILLVALIVLGPTKLPPAVRQVGKVVGEIRRIGQGFQQELREAAEPLRDATADLKAADKDLRETTQKPLKELTDTLKAADPRQAVKSQDKGAGAAKAKTTDGSTSVVAPGPVSWGTAAASVSPPPPATPSGEESDAAAEPALDGPDPAESAPGESDQAGPAPYGSDTAGQVPDASNDAESGTVAPQADEQAPSGSEAGESESRADDAA